MKYAIVILAAVFFLGCAQFQNTVGCYSELELGLGYDHQFGDSDFEGWFLGGSYAHGNPSIHSPVGSGEFSGNSFSEDRIGTEVRVHFMPGACQ